MKKIAFMFAAAAIFAACTGGQKPEAPEAEVVEEVVEEVAAPVATAEDSAAAVAIVGELTEANDSAFKAVLDSIVAAKAAVEQVVDEAAAAVEGAVAE